MSRYITANPWDNLKKYTGARIALGRSGVSLPTAEHLSFQMSHAMARDAVKMPLDMEKLREDLTEVLGISRGFEPVILHSSASDRREYLVRPDLGRKLSGESKDILNENAGTDEYDIALIIGDGLSARAMETNTIPFLKEFLPYLEKAGRTIAPLNLVRQCRVACGDDVAFHCKAKMAVILIGERPGLSSPDSMGIYLTWNPRPGVTTDSDRNCISNVRPEGMDYVSAASKLAYLIQKAFELKLTGVNLKDDQEPNCLTAENTEKRQLPEDEKGR